MKFKRVIVTILFAMGFCAAAAAQDTLLFKGMLSDTLMLENATVTARSKEQKLREGAYSVNALNIKAVTSALNSISTAVDRTSGVRIREEGGMGSDYDLSINGLSGNSIRYFLDGVPLDSKGSGITLANLPVNMIERVEIYKGVIPAAFGSDALGGAVNIVTDRRKRNYTDFSVGGGSFHTARTDYSAQYLLPGSGLIIRPVIGAAYSKNDYVMHDVKIRNEAGTDFIITDCPRFHDGYRSLFGQLEAGVTQRSWADECFVSASFSKVDKEVQTGATQTHVIGMAERNSEALNLSARYAKRDFLAKGLDATLSLSHTRDHSQTIDTTYRKYYWDGTWIDGAYSEIRGRGKTLRDYRRPMTFLRSNFNYVLGESNSLGLNWFFSNIGNIQKDLYDTSFEPSEDWLSKHVLSLSFNNTAFSGKMVNTAFVKDYINHLRIGQTEMPAMTGVREIERVSTKNYLGYGAGTRWSPVEPFSLKASYEHSVRLPVSRELLGNGSTVYPNLTLEPEQSDNFNLGFFGAWEPAQGHRFSYEVNGFVRLVDNYIQAVVSEQSEMMQYVNVEAVHVKGVDAELRYDWNGALHLAVNASWDDSRDQRQYTRSGQPSVTYRNRTPNRPWAWVNAEAAYTFYRLFGSADRLRIVYDYRWVHWFYLTWEAYGSPSSKSYVPEQYLSDVSLLYAWKGGRYNLSLECTNLFDRLSYDNYLLQKPGRAFFLKFRLFLH